MRATPKTAGRVGGDGHGEGAFRRGARPREAREIAVRYILLVALGICRTGVQRTEVGTATLTAENLVGDLFIRFQSRGEVFLLLFDVVQRLVDCTLFPFCSQQGRIQCGKLA